LVYTAAFTKIIGFQTLRKVTRPIPEDQNLSYNIINKPSSIDITILEKCQNGATKADLKNASSSLPMLSSSVSYSQLRRYTAELTDKMYLQYEEHKRQYVTTDKGIVFLNSKKDQKDHSDICSIVFLC